MLLRRLITAAMAAIVLGSCTGDGRPAGYAEGIFFPTYPRSPDGAYPDALLADVMLVESDDCLFADQPERGRFFVAMAGGVCARQARWSARRSRTASLSLTGREMPFRSNSPTRP
jgi:hypothetical protein